VKKGFGSGKILWEGQRSNPNFPPGQHLVQGFPVLDLGTHPEIPLESWQLTITGLVNRPVTWTWKDFEALPKTQDTSDFHCVTTWSTFDNRWEGVSFRHLMETVQPLPEAVFVYSPVMMGIPLTFL
jgi:DMSO/TMAO reductase YedYZ molybdopterin-dependent catalytic subunit